MSADLELAPSRLREPRCFAAQDPPSPDRWDDPEADLELRERTERPRRFRVIMHNDDYTTMEFVIRVLKDYFNKNDTEATHLMLQVHYKGLAVAGVYPKDTAETKIRDVAEDARVHGMPLRCTMEPE